MTFALLAILAIASVYGVLSMATYSYFNDVEVVKSTMIAGTWMGIDTTSAILTGNGWTNLHGIFIIPGGPGSDNKISKIAISWTGGEGKVTEIRIGGHKFWSGIGNSGQELTSEDGYIVDKKSVNEYSFDSDVHGKTFTIDFTMDGGQVIRETFTPKWKSEESGHEESGHEESGHEDRITVDISGDTTETFTPN